MTVKTKRIKTRKNFWGLTQFLQKIFKPKKGKGNYARKVKYRKNVEL